MKSLFSNLMNSSETQRTNSGSNPRRSSMLFSNSDDDDSHHGTNDEDEHSSPNSRTVSRQGTPSNRSASHSSSYRQPTSQSQSQPLSQRGNSAASSPTIGRGRLDSRERKSVSRDKEDDSSSTSSSFRMSRKWSKKHTQTSSTSFTSSPPSSPSHHQSFKQEQKSRSRVEEEEDEQLQGEEVLDEVDVEGEDDVMLAAKTKVVREEDLSLRNDSDDASVPVPAPLSLTDDNNDDDNSSHEDWNALTRVETAAAPTVFPFTSLVCMPSPYLRASRHWGNPRFYLQFSNFSSQWKMELYWVDADGVLIPRGDKDLLQGDSHFELFSAAHVWAVIATPLKTGLGGGANASKASINTSLVVNRASLSEPVSQLESSQSTSGSVMGRSAEDGQMIFVFRPSKACCLQESKCLSVLWSPGNALTISHLLYSKSTKQSMTSAHGKHKEDRIKPSIHIQLFETKSTTSSSLPPPPLATSSSLHPPPPLDNEAERDVESEELGRLTRKPLRSGRALSKIHTSQFEHQNKRAVKKPPPSNPPPY